MYNRELPSSSSILLSILYRLLIQQSYEIQALNEDGAGIHGTGKYAVMDADKIIVLENGRIIGQGTHNELRKECKVYREIALSQLTESEVDA